ncbi:MAG: FkbM family methyltransferase [Actinomycetota bacterium]|nr:FkbM family methyltransferase [Actinomycetota bacterium]
MTEGGWRALREWPRASAASAYHRLRRSRLIGPMIMRAIEARLDGATTARVTVRAGPLRGMSLDIDPRVQADVVLGVYERRLSRHALGVLREGHTAFDVGSHLGYFALLMATAVGASGSVVCFEPNDSLHAALDGNVRRNRDLIRADVSISRTAVGAVSGSTTFFKHDRSTRGRLGSGGETRVDVTTLDEAAEAFGSPRFVKIDVEGGEIDVLSGAPRLLAARTCGFGIEIHSPELGAGCAALLRDHGYVCRSVRDRGRLESYLLAEPSGRQD